MWYKYNDMLKGLVVFLVLLILACGIAYGIVKVRAYIVRQHELNWAQIEAKRLELNQAGPTTLSVNQAQRQEHERRVQSLLTEIEQLEQRDLDLDELPTEIMAGVGVLLLFAAHPLLCWMVARRKQRHLVLAVLGGLFLPPLALGYYYGLPVAQAVPTGDNPQQSNPLALVLIVLVFHTYGIGYIIGSLQKPLPLRSPQR